MTIIISISIVRNMIAIIFGVYPLYPSIYLYIYKDMDTRGGKLPPCCPSAFPPLVATIVTAALVKDGAGLVG